MSEEHLQSRESSPVVGLPSPTNASANEASGGQSGTGGGGGSGQPTKMTEVFPEPGSDFGLQSEAAEKSLPSLEQQFNVVRGECD